MLSVKDVWIVTGDSCEYADLRLYFLNSVIFVSTGNKVTMGDGSIEF